MCTAMGGRPIGIVPAPTMAQILNSPNAQAANAQAANVQPPDAIKSGAIVYKGGPISSAVTTVEGRKKKKDALTTLRLGIMENIRASGSSNAAIPWLATPSASAGDMKSKLGQ